MADAKFSFDIVSEVDMQEVDNAVNQAKKELAQRYDFKTSKSSIEFNREEKKIFFQTEDEFRLQQLKDMLGTKMAKRGVSLKALDFKEPEKIFGEMLKQEIEITTGMPKERTKELVKIIKDLNLKVQAAIEGEKVRVSGAKKDDLQSVIAHLRALDFPIPLQFCNYR